MVSNPNSISQLLSSALSFLEHNYTNLSLFQYAASRTGTVIGVLILLGGTVDLRAQNLPSWAEPGGRSGNQNIHQEWERCNSKQQKDQPVDGGTSTGGRGENPYNSNPIGSQSSPFGRPTAKATSCGNTPNCTGVCCQKQNGDLQCFQNRSSCPGSGGQGGGGQTEVPLSPFGQFLLALTGGGFAVRKLLADGENSQ